MTDVATPADPTFRVVVNDEEQYSIWPEHKAVPPGWRDAGLTAGKQECLAHIEKVWTDMRPRSVREAAEDPSPRQDAAEPSPLVRLIAEVLETDPAAVDDEAGPGRSDGWTSLKHIQIVTALERAFGLSLSHAEIRGMTSVAVIRETLRARGAGV